MNCHKMRLYSRKASESELRERLLVAALCKSAEEIEIIAELSDSRREIYSHQDEYGDTAVHYILSKGCFCNECEVKRKTCLEILLQGPQGRIIANMENHAGKTPMHLVAERRVSLGLVRILVQGGGNVFGENQTGIKYKDLVQELVEDYPEVLELLFDEGVKFSGNMEDPDELALNFRYITYNPKLDTNERNDGVNHDPEKNCFTKRKDSKTKWHETRFLFDIYSWGDSSTEARLIGHPLVQKFIELKRTLLYAKYSRRVAQSRVAGLFLYYCFIYAVYYNKCRYSDNDVAISDCNSYNSAQNVKQEATVRAYGARVCQFQDNEWRVAFILGIVSFLFISCSFFTDMVALTVLTAKVFSRRWRSWVYTINFFLVSASVLPIIRYVNNTCMVLSWEYYVTALSTVSSSLAFLFTMGEEFYGAEHLHMVLNVSRRIVLAAFCLLPLYIGFFAAFKILIASELGPFAFLTMIVSDTNFEDLLYQNRGWLYEGVVYFFFAAFIIFMIIIVLNYLIGIAVSDIQELKQNAIANDLKTQIYSYFVMESVLKDGMKSSITDPANEDTFHQKLYPLKTRAQRDSDGRLSRNSSVKSLDLRLLDIARKGCTDT